MPDCQQYNQLYQEFASLKERFNEKMEEFRKEGIIDEEMEELKRQLKEKQKEILPLFEKHQKDASYEFMIDKRRDIAQEYGYQWIGEFRDGILRAQKEDGWYFINQDGEQIAGPFRGADPFSEGLASVEKEDGKEIYIDKFGREFGK